MKTNTKKKDDKKKIQQEGFETYQECYPLELDEDEQMKEYTVTKAVNASVVEDAQSMFIYWLVFLVAAIVCSIIFPIMTIAAVIQDFKDGGLFFRGSLTLSYIFMIFMSFYLLSNITGRTSGLSDVGIKAGRQTKIILGMFLMACVFFIYLSVTFAKISGMQISETYHFGEYFDCDSAFTYVDVFGLTLDSNDSDKVTTFT